MNKIKDIFYSIANWLGDKTGIRADYILHFGVCFLLSLFGSYGAALAIGWSFGKETGDYNNPNSGWSWGDLVADGLGIAAGLAVNMAIKAIIN